MKTKNDRRGLLISNVPAPASRRSSSNSLWARPLVLRCCAHRWAFATGLAMPPAIGKLCASIRNAATSVLGSRPASEAATFRPPRERHRKLIVALEYLFGRDDHTGAPVDAARRPAGADARSTRRATLSEKAIRGLAGSAMTRPP